jgi:predicted acetyltransferase
VPTSPTLAGGVAIRPLALADLDDLFDLRNRAFGPVSADARSRANWQAEHEPDIPAGRYLGAFDGARLVAAARFHDMTQWWRGRGVPMAGVASVAVAPEERGRGIGRALVTGLLDLIDARGYPLATLYPSTLPIYRSRGWEIAGTSYEAVFDASGLRELAVGSAPADGLRRAAPGDAARLCEVLGRAHAVAGDCGPVVRTEAFMRLVLDGDGSYYLYLADDGVLAYTWQQGHDEILVHTLVAASQATTRALWGVVASHCWIADRVRARVSPADPVWWLTRDPVADLVDHDAWMLRVVDAPAAIAARGFPPSVQASLQLRITDPVRPGHAGLWRLEIGGGAGSLTRLTPPGDLPVDGQEAGSQGDAAGPLTLGARGLAALYAGTPVATLRRAGLASGGVGSDALLDGVFAATPFMLDRF